MRDGYTIEEHYQLRGKQRGILGVDHWKVGKGRPPLDPSIDLWAFYKGLWKDWCRDNPDLFKELRSLASEKERLLTDRFATTEVSQARALAELLNELEHS